jgi:pimeloyl-ACP methyl ester carboxylesterase
MRFSAEPTAEARLRVDGCEIAWARWGDPSAIPILLVHGAGAQMGWWDGVIAELVPELTVLAVDLSGHGDSGWRDQYSGEEWANEVGAVVDAGGGGPPILVGHSLGGRVAIVAAAQYPGLVRELVLVDSPGDVSRVAPRRSGQPARRHVSLKAAIEAFQLQPPEVIRNQELLWRVAAHSYREVDGSWELKADRHVFRRVDHDVVARNLAATAVPITEIWGESSPVVTEEVLRFVADVHPGPTDFVGLPGGHHLLFDHAPAIASVVKARWASLTAGAELVGPKQGATVGTNR